MSLDTLRDQLPAYAKDLSLNLSSLAAETVLNDQQKWGSFLASAHAVGQPDVIKAVEAASGLSPEAKDAAKAAAAIMGMNNVYYRFLHLVEHQKYSEIRAGLRMNMLRMHGTSPVDFELFCEAVSAINGCGACIASHDRVVREKGLSEETILAAIRIASVIHAAAVVLDAESN